MEALKERILKLEEKLKKNKELLYLAGNLAIYCNLLLNCKLNEADIYITGTRNALEAYNNAIFDKENLT